MEPLRIEGTEETPFVHLDKLNNIFEITGNSYPEDSTAFYRPVIQWVNDYAQLPNDKSEFTFSFVYFNSSSYKSIYDIIYLLRDISEKKRVEVKVNWLFKEGDSDIMDIGEELSEAAKIPFSILPVK